MCYAIPGKVIKLKKNLAVLDYYGEERIVLNEYSHIKVNDYVYAQGGILLEVVESSQAQEILEFWKEKFFELKKIDEKLSKIDEKNSSKNILKILQKINTNKKISNKEILILLEITNSDELNLLYKTANNQRQKHCDNACCVHGIIEFSNYCINNCEYCGIRKDAKIKRYRMTPKEIIKQATIANKVHGFKAIVLQSGEDPFYTEGKLIYIIKELNKLGILIFLSIGIRSNETYKKLYEAGARAVLLRFETSNEKIFKKLRPFTNLKDRIKLIKKLKKIGYLIATGFIFGLPGETNQDIINNINLTKEIADMYSFGPLIPCKNTPLHNYKKPDISLALKVIAICRLLDKESKILVTTALETLNTDAKKQGLLAGANSLMINAGEKKYKKLYSIYNKRNNEIKKDIDKTINLLYSIGRAPTDLGI